MIGNGAVSSLSPQHQPCMTKLWSPRPWHPCTHLADVQELIQGHALVQVQRLPQGSVLLALPAGRGAWG